MKKRSVAMALAMSLLASSLPVAAQAEDIVIEEGIVDEVVEDDEVSDVEILSDDEDSEIDVIIEDEDLPEQAEEILNEENDIDSEEELLMDEDDTYIAEEAEELQVEDEEEAEESEDSVDLKRTTVGSATYAFINLAGVEDKENLVYKLTVSGRGGTTVTNYSFTDLQQMEGTDYYYIVTAGKDLIGETVYSYTGNVASSQTYSQIYQSLGVDAASTDYDVISSATNYASFHAKDISGTVTYGTDASGNKVINGITRGREIESVSGTEYVKAMLLAADGAELTEDQTALTHVTLKKNPTSGNNGEKSVALSSASYTTSRYGIGEFAIVPDATVEGYVWDEYWDSVYAATISDGTTTAGAVHWIDIYGESATSGPHYNKIELALNSGTALASNAAEVNRFDAFIDEGSLKPGKYTVTIYADGYNDLTATVINPGESIISLADQKITYSGSAPKVSAEVSGSSADVTYHYYSDEACTDELTSAPVEVGTYYVTASVAADEVFSEATSDVAKLVIEKAASSVTLKALTTAYTGKAIAIGKANVTGSSGKITYTYYSDASCKTALKSAPVNAGTYYVKASVAANNNYNAATSKAVKLVINKKASTIKVKTAKANYKVAAVKKAAKSFSMGASVDSKGKLTYKKASGSKCLTVDKSGKIKIAKKTKKGTYTAKIKITSAATKNYKAATKTVTVKVVVK